jgi:hypothetical protein
LAIEEEMIAEKIGERCFFFPNIDSNAPKISLNVVPFSFFGK